MQIKPSLCAQACRNGGAGERRAPGSPGFDLTFARSQRNQVYRSLDGGITWTNEMARILDDEGQEAQGISAIWINPIDSKRMFLVGSALHWLTIDGGLGARLRHRFVLLRGGRPDAPSGGEGCNIQLHLTQDAGRTWRQVSSYVIGFSWACQTPPTTRYARFVCGTKDGFRKGNQDFSQWDMNAEVRRTDNLWKSEGTAVPHGTAFLWVERFLFVGLLNPLEPQEIKLKVSRDNGRPSTMRSSLQAERGGVHGPGHEPRSRLRLVAHSCERDSGNVYLSNSAGNRYSLAIRGVPRNAVGKTDFEKIKSLEGVYVANTFGERPPGPVLPPGGRAGAAPPAPHAHLLQQGSFWMKVRPPFVDANGAPYVDSDGTPCESVWKTLRTFPRTRSASCSSTWRRRTSMRRSLAPNATGIVIRDGQRHTFLSRDGGLTWTEIAKGSHVYEFGDTARFSSLYSWDEGKTWRNFDFSDVDVSVDNVVASPHAVESDCPVRGVIVHVDFPSAHAHVRGRAERPGLDYEPGLRARTTEISRKTALHEADFECGSVQPLWPVQNNIPIDCPDGSTFFVTNGYSGWRGILPDARRPRWLVFLVVCCVLGAAAAAGAFLYRYRNSDSLGAVKELWSRWEAKLGRHPPAASPALSGAEGAEGLLDDDMDAEASAEPLPEPLEQRHVRPRVHSLLQSALRCAALCYAWRPTVASLSAAAAAGAGSGPATASPSPAGRSRSGASSLFDIGDFGQLTAAAARGPRPPTAPARRGRRRGDVDGTRGRGGPSGPRRRPRPKDGHAARGGQLLDDDVLGKGSS
eukprot:tig00020554_g10788.t1